MKETGEYMVCMYTNEMSCYVMCQGMSCVSVNECQSVLVYVYIFVAMETSQHMHTHTLSHGNVTYHVSCIGVVCVYVCMLSAQ